MVFWDEILNYVVGNDWVAVPPGIWDVLSEEVSGDAVGLDELSGLDWVIRVDAVQDVIVVMSDGVEGDDMVGKATIVGVVLAIKDKIDQVESRKEGGL